MIKKGMQMERRVIGVMPTRLSFRFRPIASLLEAGSLRYRAFGIRLKKLKENENRDLIREI